MPSISTTAGRATATVSSRPRASRSERRAGRAVYGGVIRPVPVDPALVGRRRAGPFKNGAFINVIRHGGQLLALGEAKRLRDDHGARDGGRVAGRYRRADRPGAHNRRHPRTGELFALTYAVERPLVRFHRIDASGRLVRELPGGARRADDDPRFRADRAAHRAPGLPVVFDLRRPQRGRAAAAVEAGARDADRRGRAGRRSRRVARRRAVLRLPFRQRLRAHGRIVVDYVRHARLGRLGHRPATARRRCTGWPSTSPAAASATSRSPGWCRVPARRTSGCEAMPTRFVYSADADRTLGQQDPPSGTFNAIAKTDTETGGVARHDFGDRMAGEAVFVPRRASRPRTTAIWRCSSSIPPGDQRLRAARRRPCRRRARGGGTAAAAGAAGLHGNWIAHS